MTVTEEQLANFGWCVRNTDKLVAEIYRLRRIEAAAEKVVNLTKPPGTDPGNPALGIALGSLQAALMSDSTKEQE